MVVVVLMRRWGRGLWEEEWGRARKLVRRELGVWSLGMESEGGGMGWVGSEEGEESKGSLVKARFSRRYSSGLGRGGRVL